MSISATCASSLVALHEAVRSLRSGECTVALAAGVSAITTVHGMEQLSQTQALSPLTFGIIRRDVQDILTATDAQLVECMRFFAERMKLVVEPTGCLALAGALHGGLDLRGRRVGVIVSGGNVDLQRYGQYLGEGL
jgi:threonine dehydratase